MSFHSHYKFNLIYFISIENQSSSEQLKDSTDRMEDTTHEAFLNSYLSLDNDDLLKIAHQPADMIKHCKMHSRHGTEKCNELIQGIANPFTAIYGVCYMFNFAVKGYTNNTLVSNYGGPSFGLELILDIEIKYFAFLNHYSTYSFASNMLKFSSINEILFFSCRSLLYAKWIE